MNTTPAPGQKQPRREGPPRPRESACFGRGIRFLVGTVGNIQWSTSLSLPLGVSAILLVTVVSSLVDGSPVVGSQADDWWRDGLLPLALFWSVALLIQLILTQLLCSLPVPRWFHAANAHRIESDRPQRRTMPIRVTLTLGGVWIAIPDLVADGATIDADTSAEKPHRTFDAPPRPRMLESFHGASQVLFLWSLVLMSLGIATMTCLLMDSPGLSVGTPVIAAMDRPWVVAGWIFCLQGFWQLLPLPQSLGRVGWSTAIGLFAAAAGSGATEREHAAEATAVVRWWVVGFAVGVLIVGLAAISFTGISTQAGGRALPALAGVALLFLWLLASARAADLFALQLILVENGETGIMKSQLGIVSTWKRWQQSRQDRQRIRRLRETSDRERAEASDAAQVDDILQRLHSGGPASLSDEERAILNRVSEAIRREREREGRPT